MRNAGYDLFCLAKELAHLSGDTLSFYYSYARIIDDLLLYAILDALSNGTHTYSREDLIVKTMTDIPAFDRAKAEQEVDKFLMDYEMANLYIQYGKEIEKDPDFVVPDNNQEEGLFSFRTVVILYLCYVAATTIPDMVRQYIAEQEAAGTWSPTNIAFIDDWIASTSKLAGSLSNQAADVAVTPDLAAAALGLPSVDLDAVSSATATLQNVADAVQAGLQ